MPHLRTTPKRNSADDAWNPRAVDMPLPGAFRTRERQFNDLRENPLFRWLVQSSRRGRLPGVDDLNPTVAGLLLPLFPVILVLVFVRTILRHSAMGRGRRGLLMHLPEPLLRDIVQTRLVLGDVVTAIWAFELRAAAHAREARWLLLSLAALLMLSLSRLSFVLCPLVALVMARLMIRGAYPYDCFPRMVRVLRRQAAETQGRHRAGSLLGLYFETIVGIAVRGCGFLLLLGAWIGVVLAVREAMMVDAYLYEFNTADYVLVALASAFYGMAMGHFVTIDLRGESERYLQDIYGYTDEIVQHWWQAHPFDGAGEQESTGTAPGSH